MLALIEWKFIVEVGLPDPLEDVFLAYEYEGEEHLSAGYIDTAGVWHFTDATPIPWPVTAWTEYPYGPAALRALAGELPLTPHASPLTETTHG